MEVTPFSPEWDKRNSPRHRLGVLIILQPGDRRVMTRDLSQEGCFLPGVDLGPVDATVPVRLDIPGFGVFFLKARIVHKGSDQEGTGIEFLSLSPEALDGLDRFLGIFSS